MLEDKAQHAIADVSALLPLIVSNALNALAAILILLIGLWYRAGPACSWSGCCGRRRISIRCCKASSVVSPAIWY